MQLELLCHILIVKDPAGGSLYSWCPELDVVSQGDSPQEATAMCAEACRLAIECDLYPQRYALHSHEPIAVRIRHPFRRGLEPHVKTDPDHAIWDDYMECRGKWGATVNIRAEQFMAGREAVGITHVRFEVATYCGLVFVNGPNRYDHLGEDVRVPAKQFRVEYTETFNRSTTFEVRATDLEDGDPKQIVGEMIRRELTEADGRASHRFSQRGQAISIKTVRTK